MQSQHTQTYKIIESSIEHFKNIELPVDFSNYQVGSSLNILGLDMKITQIGEVVGCSNSENILVFQKINLS